MFRLWGSAENQPNQPPPHDASEQSSSWYPHPVAGDSFARPRHGTPHRPGDRPQSPSHVSPAEAAGITDQLKDKSADELRKLLQDKDAYNQFLLSVDQIKVQNNLREELRKETLQLAEKNLEKETQIMELQNQSTIIRTTELAAAQERYSELERRKEETLKAYSPASLLQKLHRAMNEIDEESESLHRQLLIGEVEPGVFLQKYKKLRIMYHRRQLLHLAAKTSVGNG